MVMEDTLVKNVSELLLESISNIFLVDIINNFIYEYRFENGVLNNISKKELSSYLDGIKEQIKQEDVKEYMNAISLPKLEENNRLGNSYISFSYKTIDNKCYDANSMIVDFNGNKCILLINRLSKEKNSGENSAKYNSLIETVADSILKVHNVFNMDEKTLSNIDGVKNYIDSVFSNLTNSYPELKKSFKTQALNVSGRSKNTILIVDDDALTRNMIKKIFDDEYKIVMANNGKEAIEYIDSNRKKGAFEQSDHIVSIFLDLTMPVMDGFAVLDYLSDKNYLNKIPVIIISGDYERETKTRVYSYNIADMLEKPFDFEIVRHRISNFINLYKSSNSLNSLINNQNNDLKDIIDAYIKAYYVDYDSSIKSISNYIKILATKVMEDYDEYDLNTIMIDKMADAVMYYDIGFYSVPRSVLLKQGNYTKEDINIIRNYPLFGSKVLDYVLSMTSDEVYKKLAQNICKFARENYDGTGYPNNLSKDNIPVEAQIAAVAITYNNIKNKTDKPEDVILSKSGTIFNPKIVNSFKKVIQEFKNI